MKKSGVIFSALVMCMALVVALVGISAAWFGDTKDVSETIIITSNKPSGSASIAIDSMHDPSASGEFLSPAVANPGWLLLGKYDYSAIDVLDAALIGADKPLTAAAHPVTVEFPFQYEGTPDGADGTKAIIITLKNVTLENPRDDKYQDISGGMKDYSEQFAYSFAVAETPPVIKTSSSGREIYMQIYPFKEYTFTALIYFAYIDEECSPELIGRVNEGKGTTKVFFNFEIAITAPRA